MKAYIDKFNLIRIESNEQINKVSINGFKGSLKRVSLTTSFFELDKELKLSKNYFIFINEYKIDLEIGLVTQTPEFDFKYRYDGPLGAIYFDKHTDFYVWSPVAKDIKLILDNKEYDMLNQGDVWHLQIMGNHDLKPYYYKVKIGTFYEKVLDPYAKAGTNEYSYVLNFNHLKKVVKSPNNYQRTSKKIIYEGHIRDMSISLDVKSKGLFHGLIEKSKMLNGSVLDYIKNLGATHLQLLPVSDFLGVDDFNKDKYYNWGYNPHQFFLIDGWYSSNPNDPLLRINELIDVINYAHQIGLLINLDIVFNHVYDWVNFSFNKMAPNYLYQFDKNGSITNFSGCQNDVASYRYMVRRLIVDTVVYLTKTFKIDGFRFDLMGLMDIKTMLLIEKELTKINPKIMLYGEGWNMPNTMKPEIRANMANQKQIKAYAHFNDQFRNLMKGHETTGYAMGGQYDFDILSHSLLGSLNIFDNIQQSINYVECHDNYTFYDEIGLKTKLNEYRKWHYQDFATHLVLISQGVSFIHAGQEFYRSKAYVENSYKSSDAINKIDWNPHLLAVTKLRELINIVKTYNGYSYNNKTLKTVENKDGFIIYTLINNEEKIVHYLQNDYQSRKIKLEGGQILFTSQDYSLTNNTITTSTPGVYAIIYKQD